MFDSVFPVETSGAAFSLMNRSLCAISTGTGAHMSKHHLSLNGINDIVQVNMVNKLIKELSNDLYRRLSDGGFIFEV